MTQNFTKNRYKQAPLLLFFAAISIVCSSTTARALDDPKVTSGKIVSVNVWTHGEKGTDSTADYQACKYNNNENSEATSLCMKERGWKSIKLETLPKKKFYGKEKIESCLSQSKVKDKIDFEMMNQCINRLVPTDDSGIESTKSITKIEPSSLQITK